MTSYGQDSIPGKSQRSFFSIHSGVIFSEFIPGQKSNEEYRSPGYSYSYNVTYYKEIDPGILAGINYEYCFSKSFSLVSQINYTTLKKHIKYNFSSVSAAPSLENDSANYNMTASTIQIPIGLKRKLKIFNISCGAYFNKPFNEKAIDGYYKSQGYSFNNYPNNFDSHDTIFYAKEIKPKMQNEFGLFFSLSRFINVKNFIFSFEAGYGIGLLRIIKYPNYRNNFYIVNLGVSYKRK